MGEKNWENSNSIINKIYFKNKTIWNFPRKLKMEMHCDPTVPLLGLYFNNPETPIQKNLCTQVHGSRIYNRQVLEAT